MLHWQYFSDLVFVWCFAGSSLSDFIFLQFSIIIYGSFPFVYGSESDYQNVEFLTFINPEHVIYDIGTEILMFHCFATKMLKSFCKSIIFSGIESSRRDLAF